MGRPRLGPLKADQVYTVRLAQAEARLFDLARDGRSPSEIVRLWLGEAICQGSKEHGYPAQRRGPGAHGREVVCSRCHRKFPRKPRSLAVPLHTREGLVLEESRSAK